MRQLNILHVLRAPVGGLFRHVVDLAREQAARGHRVGLIADATTGADRAEQALTKLAPQLVHGIVRIPMSRHLGISDLAAQRAVALLAQAREADVIHGHGAKGGAYARLASRKGAIRVYTPHGGSLHYRRSSPIGFMYLTLERVLMARTELLLFESAYGRDVFYSRVGVPSCTVRVVHNGVGEAEFLPITLAPGATDVLFVGELRMLKGVDVLIDALALLTQQGTPISATIVGDGPDAAQFRQRAMPLGSLIRFPGALPARDAFALGRLLVVPSRAESLPYIVLEAGAAGLPLIATTVGGIGEIFGPQADRLIPPADPAALAAAIRAHLAAGSTTHAAAELQNRIRAQFSVEHMTDQVLAGYAEALG